MFGREEGKVFEVDAAVASADARRVCAVENFGIDEREFGAADTIGLHLLEFMEDFRLGDRGPEPPPAHHWLCAIRWMKKIFAKLLQSWCSLRRHGQSEKRYACGNENASAMEQRHA